MTEAPGRHEADHHKHAEHHGKLRFLLRAAAALASTTVVTAGLGFVYWAVAARTFPAAAVGESSTAISAMNLIAPLTMLGFGTLLMTALPTMKHGRPGLVSTAALVSGTTAGVAALICAFLLPPDFIGLPGIGSQIGVDLLFAAAVATQSVGSMLDQALLSMIGGGMQLRRNTIHAVVKLVLLVVFALTLARYGAAIIFTTWLVANVVSIVVVVLLIMRDHKVAPSQLLPELSVLRGLHFDAFRHHSLNTSLLVPYFAMPIVANVVLGSEQAGYLFAAWSVAGFVFFVPVSLSWALFASGARDDSTFHLEFRKTLRYSMVVCIAANVVMAALGGVILSIFGTAYAANAHIPLIVLCLGGLGLVVKDHHVALARVTGNVSREAVLVGVLSAAELAGAAIGAARGGLTGLTLGWLAAVILGTLVYSPRVLRAYRGHIDVSEPAGAGQ